MNDNSITLTTSEQRRLTVLTQVEAGRLSKEEAAELVGITERQRWRLRTAFRRRGAGALVHGNRGRRPVNAVDPDLVSRVVELATSTYAGFNQHHLAEMLAERENLACGVSKRRSAAGGRPEAAV